jgi:ATPase subunit of ABC transporter with duplicated ATPase domains
LFEGVNVTFNDGERYGLTGPNGSGKSTFMKILTGELEPMGGHVVSRGKLGVLRQDHSEFKDEKIIDVVLRGNPRLYETLHEKAQLLALGDDLSDEDGMRLGNLEVVVAEEDGYTAEAEATELLDGLGIPEARHEDKLETLQGGDRVRVLLAQALFGKPDTLLLDEPTNALDLGSIRWLESFLTKYQGALVVISHDRHFLNEVCTRIADIDYETIIVYPGNYDDMVSSKAEARGALELQNSARQQKIEQLQEFVQRFRAGSRASQVRSRERQVDREKKTLSDLKRSNIQRPFIRFTQKRRSGKNVLNAINLCRSFGETRICKDFNISVARGSKIALVGPNGVGKTTMLRLLEGQLKPDSGTLEWGYETQVGFMPQDHSELVKKSDQTAREWLWSFNSTLDEENLRALFGRLLFKKDEPLKPTKVLSGGETVRLLLARLMLLEPNVLLLDEPTNHLDLEAIRALTEALKHYEGTCIFVTHDRQMVSQVADRVIEMSGETIRELSPDEFNDGRFLLNHKLHN